MMHGMVCLLTLNIERGDYSNSRGTWAMKWVSPIGRMRKYPYSVCTPCKSESLLELEPQALAGIVHSALIAGTAGCSWLGLQSTWRSK